MPPEHEANNTDVCEAPCLFHETSAVVIFFFFLLFDFQLAPHLKHLPHRTAAVAGLLYFR